jgi:hypothetical protein
MNHLITYNWVSKRQGKWSDDYVLIQGTPSVVDVKELVQRLEIQHEDACIRLTGIFPWGN